MPRARAALANLKWQQPRPRAEGAGKRHRDLSGARNQAVCRLHAPLCELIPGGVADEITAGQAARLLDQFSPSEPVAQARGEVAAELLADIRYLDARRREARAKLAAAVKASGTSLTGRPASCLALRLAVTAG